jgi:hypothetical protein
MKRILPPGRHALYPDRDLDCQEAIEAAFQEFTERAVAAGWRPLEVAEAVGQLAIADRYCRQSKACVDAYNMLDDVVAEHSRS